MIAYESCVSCETYRLIRLGLLESLCIDDIGEAYFMLHIYVYLNSECDCILLSLF